jgi:hypothetical protein
MKMTTTISRSVLARTVAASRLHNLASRTLAALLILFMGLTLAAPLHAQLTSNPSVQIADFNGDGIPDILVPSPSTGSFTLTFGAVPFGSFSAISKAVPYPANCTSPVAGGLAVGDLNGDGIADIALTCTHSPSEFLSFTTYILLGAGDGTFTVSATLVSGLRKLAVGDFNHDGKLDLVEVGVTGHTDGNFIYFFAGNGDGTFAAPVTTRTQAITYSSVLAVDLDNDGYPDLALGNFISQTTNTLDIYRNNQNGTFGSVGNVSTPTASVNVGAYPASNDTAILAGNFFGTGLPDLAVVDIGTTPGVFIIQNNSTDGLSFGTPAKTAVTGLTAALAASFTTSFSDLLVSNGTNLSVLANDATGKSSFAATYTGLTVASAATLFAAADANGDGHADIYTATLTTTGATLAVDLVSGTASATSTAFSLPAGQSPVSALWPGNLNFAGTTLTGTQTVGGLTPTLTWPTPAAIPYGTALSATQLDATATNASGVAVPGTFVYTPAAGTVLGVGTHTLSVTFTPTDLVTYTVATGTVTLLVNQATPTLTWTPAVGTITYGTPLGASQLNAVATGVAGAAVPGTFAYTPANGAVLGAGTQNLSVVFTPTDAVDYVVARGTAQITVTQAAPVITWATPAPIAYGTPLSATQLDATATGVTGAALAGTFSYTPASGSILNPGSQTLSTTFTPTDTVDYSVGSATVKITITDVTLNSFTPSSAPIASPDTTITITGSGLVSTTVVQVNGTAIATTLVNPTTLTAVIPAADFLVPGNLQITLKNPTTGSVSTALAFTVSAPTLSGSLTAPPTTAPGTQPTLNFTLPNAYPVDLTATLTISLQSSISSGVTDTQNVLFANGSNTFTFVIKAGTTTVPTIQLSAGTVAETITVTPTLFIGDVNVTPDGLAPATIDVPAQVPQTTTTTLTRSGSQLTVTVIGFSNTREIVSAAFHFVPSPGATLTQSDFSPAVNGIFSTWYAGEGSLTYGSSFTYTQVFDVSDTAANIGSVQVTLTNTVGTSTVETAQ